MLDPVFLLRSVACTSDSLINDVEFSLLNNLNESIAEKRKKSVDVAQDAVGIFCKCLAMELKELLVMERCMAKNQMQNILYNYQMAEWNNWDDRMEVFPNEI